MRVSQARHELPVRVAAAVSDPGRGAVTHCHNAGYKMALRGMAIAIAPLIEEST